MTYLYWTVIVLTSIWWFAGGVEWRKWPQAVAVMPSINHCCRRQLIMTLLKLPGPISSLANIVKKKKKKNEEFNTGYEVSWDQ